MQLGGLQVWWPPPEDRVKPAGHMSPCPQHCQHQPGGSLSGNVLWWWPVQGAPWGTGPAVGGGETALPAGGRWLAALCFVGQPCRCVFLVWGRPAGASQQGLGWAHWQQGFNRCVGLILESQVQDMEGQGKSAARFPSQCQFMCRLQKWQHSGSFCVSCRWLSYNTW